MKRNPIADGLKAENLTTNPAGIHQVLGFLQKAEETEAGLEAYAPNKAVVNDLYRGWKLWPLYKVVHSKTISFMIGLGLIEKALLPLPLQNDPAVRKGRLVLTDTGASLRQILKDRKCCTIDFRVVNEAETITDSKTGIQISKLYDHPNIGEVADSLRKNTYLYTEVRNAFLSSPCYKVFEDFMYENCDSVMTRDELQELYYRELNLVYGNGNVGSIKSEEERSENSSGSTPAQNNCVSILEWCEFFEVIKYDSNGNAVFDLNTNELVKRRIEQTETGKKQIIFTGAPGTGKTHSLLNYVKGKDYKFVQFHSSFDYTDFVEGIRPAPGDDGKNLFVRMDGLFKSYCRTIVNRNLETLQAVNPTWNLEKCFEILSRNPDTDDKIQEQNELVSAIDNLPKYYFIIDEINRADLSKVFGELLFALEDSYRGVEHHFPTQYHNMQTYEIQDKVLCEITDDCFENGFFIPKNLVILGSMNDIDKSVESVDFALRRRFDWCEIIANNVMKQSLISMKKTTVEDLLESDIKKPDNNLVDRIIRMNDMISLPENGLGREYHVGPAYFKLYDQKENNLIEVYNYRIRPLIKEYLRGRDEDEINRILSSCLSSLLGESDIEDYNNNDGEL